MKLCIQTSFIGFYGLLVLNSIFKKLSTGYWQLQDSLITLNYACNIRINFIWFFITTAEIKIDTLVTISKS